MIYRPGYRKQWQDLFPNLHPELGDERKMLMTKTITFVVTENCSLRCSYCYQCSKDYYATMSKETARAAVDVILGDKMNGYMKPNETPAVILDFIGGEPLLQADLIDYTLQYFINRATELDHPWARYFMVSISSNGIPLVTSEEARRFVRKWKSKLSLSITIDGNKQLHDACRVYPDGSGSYDDVVKAIEYARKHTSLQQTKVTLAPSNIQYLSESILHLYDLGFKVVNANVVFEEGWTINDARILYQEMIKLADILVEKKLYEDHYCSLLEEDIGSPLSEDDNKNWCGGNGLMLAVGTDGRMFPCIRFMKYSLANKEREEFEIGDINRGIDSEEDNKYLQCLSGIDRRSQSTDECWHCPVARGCAWCTGYNYDKFGTPNKRATFLCWMHKARVLASRYYWSKIYELEEPHNSAVVYLTEDDIDIITGAEE